MKPNLILVKSLLLAEEGDYIVVINDEAVAVIPSPHAKKETKPEQPSQSTESIIDEILEIIRSKGYCTSFYICHKLGIPRDDRVRRAEVSAHIKHLIITGRIKRCEGAKRLGPYEVVN
jgi:hypothetical protein